MEAVIPTSSSLRNLKLLTGLPNGAADLWELWEAQGTSSVSMIDP